jgi:hypothetical protein
MSGRVVWVRGGERVTGYRKTDRRQSKPAVDRTPYKLTFVPPPALGFLLPEGHIPGLIGVRIGVGGHVTIEGANLTWVYSQARALLIKCAPSWRAPISARLTRDAAPGTAASAPAREPLDQVVELRIDDNNAVLVVRRGGLLRVTDGR